MPAEVNETVPAEVNQQPSPLDQVVPLAEYAERRKGIFRRRLSFEWYCRVHHDRLSQTGALLVIAGRKFADVRKMDLAVIEDGAAAAKRTAKA